MGTEKSDLFHQEDGKREYYTKKIMFEQFKKKLAFRKDSYTSSFVTLKKRVWRNKW